MGARASEARFDPGVSGSERMSRLLEMARRVAQTDANVLLSGESGTGKGMLARYLHDASPRNAGPFVTITCANIPAGLLESELFGHEKGAFTGAVERRLGRFEQADGGTVLLDGVSELAPALQGKLLRVVQERSFERLAGTSTIEVDVRILSSTQTDLEPLVASGQFRKDLYYRLNVVRLDLPPLRERLEDLPGLADAALREITTRHGGPARRLSPGALERLLQHHWPGNMRELKNVMEGAAILNDAPEIPAGAIRIELPTAGTAPEMPRRGRSLAEIEAEHIREVLRSTGGNRAEAANILGINRKTLLEKRKRYRIP